LPEIVEKLVEIPDLPVIHLHHATKEGIYIFLDVVFVDILNPDQEVGHL
jgi:hypothetical protein